jgi:hypothetical protein
LHLLSRPRRPRRSHEWSPGKAVTFIVTLAATRSVTLAARDTGMSRKSAYALKDRDPAFAAAWNAALKARRRRRGGDETHEPHDPPVSLGQGDGAQRAARSIWSTAHRQRDEAARDLFFARLARLRVASPALARRSPAQ